MQYTSCFKLELRRTQWKEIRAERVYEDVEFDSMNAVGNCYLDYAKVRRVLSKSLKCAMTHTASCFNQSSIGCDSEKFESKKREDVCN